MRVEQWESERLRERMTVGRWPSGFQAFVWPKAGFSKKYAVFSTRYGSMDRRFRDPDTGEMVEVPDGIAHFLEHKLFEEEQGDVFERFARLGASANAYTSRDLTSYLFSCSDHFEENLDLLLEYVQDPYFSEAGVEKEKGIIEQEIRMAQDEPRHRIYQNLLQAMYHRHPVRIDILGSVESIRRITPELLYLCHRTFYHPGNMALFVVGDVAPLEVLERVDAAMAKRSQDRREDVWREFPAEPPGIVEERVVDRLNISRPRYALGFKDDPSNLEGRDLLKREAATELLLAAIFGRSTDFYQRLYEQGLIDDGFGAHYTHGRGYAFTVVGGETKDPERLHAEIQAELERVRERGVDPEDIRRLQRREIGGFLRALDSLEFIANGFLHYHFLGCSLLDYLDVLEELTVDDVLRRAREHLVWERAAASILLPSRQRDKERVSR